MKKSIGIFLCIFGFIFQIQAQNMTFELLSPPCNKDGVLKVNFTGSDTTTLYWYYNGKSVVKHGVQPPSDTIFDYGGGQVSVYKYNNGATQYGNYNSKLPFSLDVKTIINTCPTPSTAEIIVNGGTAPYSYQWFKYVNGIQTFVGNSNPINVTNGEYEVLVIDANGCQADNFTSKQDSNYIYINTPISYTYDVIKTEANCTNGSAEVTNITGGTLPFTFQWSNGSTSQSIQNLSAGNYQLTVTDGDGCSKIEYEVYINQSIAIDVPVTSTPAQCSNSDGGAIAFGSGGTPPYIYKWSNGVTGQNIANVPSGSYQVDVTDANGCKGNGYTYISATSPVVVSILSTTPSSCLAATGTAEISINGGSPPYSVAWSSFPVQTGTKLLGVPAGVYGFTVEDNAGCIRKGSVTINPESIISENLIINPADCATPNGSVFSLVTGGLAPYTYSWSNGGNSSNISSLTSGYYTLTITDSKSCAVVKSAFVDKTSPLSIGFVSVPASCIFSSDGNITANAINGTPPYSYTWSTGSTGNTISALKAGNYYVNVVDANGCNNIQKVVLPFDVNNDDCYCKIEGTVFHDVNENCIQDAGEQGIINAQMYCKGIGYTYTDANGYYSFIVPTGTYELSESIKTYSPLSGCQNNKIAVSTLAATGCVKTYNFANKLNPINDVHISLWNDNQPVPGFNYIQNLVVTNDGTIPENQVISSYKTDNQIGVPAFTPNFLNQLVSTGYYNNGPFIMLNPGNSEKIKVEYTVPTNIPLSTELYFTDSTNYQYPMSSWVNDYTPWNNVNQLRTYVVGSYDPNFIEVSPQGATEKGLIGTQDSVLEYMVHFQNLGNYFATDVRVECILDKNLDWPSVKPIYSSAPSSVTLNEKGILTYSFKNIKLYPENWNVELSKGFFTFTVKQKPGLVKDTEIKNLADIYFDFNLPVRTNNTLNTIDYRVSTNPELNEGLVKMLFPNPAGTTFSIKFANEVEGLVNINVLDLFGRSVKTEKINVQSNSVIEMNINDLSNGTYFVNLSTESGKNSTHKLVVVKE